MKKETKISKHQYHGNHEGPFNERCPKCKEKNMMINDAGSVWCNTPNCDYEDK